MGFVILSIKAMLTDRWHQLL